MKKYSYINLNLFLVLVIFLLSPIILFGESINNSIIIVKLSKSIQVGGCESIKNSIIVEKSIEELSKMTVEEKTKYYFENFDVIYDERMDNVSDEPEEEPNFEENLTQEVPSK